MNKENIDEVLRKFAHKYKNYRFSELSSDSIKKVWNHGMGLLEIYKVYPREGIIAVNDFLYNRTDERKLSLLKQMLGGEWKIVHCWYGYPEFYNHNFSLKYAIDKNQKEKTK